jgi:membrane protein YdbS with pleckstrin-like domain
MQYIEQQLTEFKAEFAKRRKRQLLVTIPIIACVVLVRVLSKDEEALFFGLPASVVIGAAFAVIAAVVAFTLWNWRCPACNKYLGKGMSPSFCSKCGIPLQ